LRGTKGWNDAVVAGAQTYRNNVQLFADRFWSADWPGAARPRVFYDPRSLQQGGPMGVLHANAVVVDDEIVFVTSCLSLRQTLQKPRSIGTLRLGCSFAIEQRR
jgi:hypothetical protein